MVVPDDLAEWWEITPHGLKRKDWDCTISFGTFPPPLCFDAARQYEAKAVETQAKRAELEEKKRDAKTKKKRSHPPEQAKLW